MDSIGTKAVNPKLAESAPNPTTHATTDGSCTEPGVNPRSGLGIHQSNRPLGGHLSRSQSLRRPQDLVQPPWGPAFEIFVHHGDNT